MAELQPTVNSLTGQAVAPTVSSQIYTPPTAAQVYSPVNVASTVSAPVTAPNLSDPYGLYDQFMNSAEIKGAQGEVTGLTNELNTLRQNTRSQVQGIGNLPENLNVLRGFQREASDKGALSEQALGENLNAKIAYLSTLKGEASNRYAIAQEERAQLQDLIRQTGGKANITYGDSYESALQKADKYITEKAKEEAKDAYKKELKQIALQYGINPKGKSTSELEKKIAKYNKSALSEAKKIASSKVSKSSIASGGYTAQEERKLRAAGIDPSDIANADRFLYQGISPQQAKESKLTDSLANTITSLMSQNVPLKNIESAVSPYGYSVSDIADAYKIDMGGYEPGGTFGTITGSGAGFWSNLWSGTKNLFK